MALFRFPQNSKSPSKTEEETPEDLFFELISYIEAFLFDFYRFNHSERVREFAIFSDTHDRPFLQIVTDSEDVEVGVVFVKGWIESGCYQNSIDNLLAIVEEVSHFHTLVASLQRGRILSQEDLEAQAEVDKVMFLLDAERRNGRMLNKSYLQLTTQKILFEAEFTQELYLRATHRADSMIAKALKNVPHVRHPSLEDLRSYLSDRHPGLRKAA